MEREMCVLCHRIHKDSHWKYGAYESPDGTKYGWFCSKWFKPSFVEFVPERIKENRKAWAKSLLQPYRQGVPSQEYIDSYGTSRINPKDIKKAKNVWGEILPRNWQKSK